MKIIDMINKIQNHETVILSSVDLVKIGFCEKPNELGRIYLRKKNTVSHFRMNKSLIRFINSDLVDYIMKNLNSKTINDEYNFDMFFVKRHKVEVKKAEELDSADKAMMQIWKALEDLNTKLTKILKS